MLFEVPPSASPSGDPRLAYVRTMLGAIEMLKYGVTAVHDDRSTVPIRRRVSGDHAGLCRFRDARDRLDQSAERGRERKYPFLRRSSRPKSAPRWTARRAGRGTARELYRWYHAKWHRAEDGRLRSPCRLGAAARDARYFAPSRNSAGRTIIRSTCTSWRPAPARLGQKKYGKSLVRYVHDLGFLDERGW